MSAGVDQRGKGQGNQVPNGPPKDQMKGEFDAYLTQPPQGAYSQAAPMSSPNVSDGAYMPNYYASMFPYLNNGGLNDAAWSNGGDPMSFLGGYGQMNNDYMSGNGMFGGFSYQPGFGWEQFSGGDYSAWGPTTNAPIRKDDRAAAYADGYYGMAAPQDTGYATMNGDMDRDMKSMDQGLKGMNIAGDKPMDVTSKDHGHHPQHVQQHHTQQHHAQVLNDVVNSGPVNAGPPVSSAPPPKKTWASIASQPAKPQAQLKPKSIPRAPVMPSKHNMDIGTWDSRNGNAGKGGGPGQQRQGAWNAPRGRSGPTPYSAGPSNGSANANGTSAPPNPSHPVLDKLKSANMYNPKDFNLAPKGTRYFIIKSYSEDDIHRSIKYSIWCSTEHGNKRLDAAYREREGKGPIYLFFSVNGSGHFCGMAQMMSALDYNSSSSVWAQDKWKGQFEVKWIYVKDVPNSQLRHIRLENNENKPVTNSRDTQEVPPEKGKQVLKILHNYKHTTSIFDDFVHYEKRQEEDEPPAQEAAPAKPERSASDRAERSAGARSKSSGQSGGGGGGGKGGKYADA
jgi:hypothetical protein